MSYCINISSLNSLWHHALLERKKEADREPEIESREKDRDREKKRQRLWERVRSMGSGKSILKDDGH